MDITFIYVSDAIPGQLVSSTYNCHLQVMHTHQSLFMVYVCAPLGHKATYKSHLHLWYFMEDGHVNHKLLNTCYDHCVNTTVTEGSQMDYAVYHINQA